MAPTPNIPEEVDFSLFGGAECLPEGKQTPASFPRRTQPPLIQNPQDVYGSKPQDPSDFLWLMTEEPHRSRRVTILKTHPELGFSPESFLIDWRGMLYPTLASSTVTKLMGHEPLTKYIVLAVVFLQLTIAFLLRHTHPLSWKFAVAAYAIGGTANHNLFLAIHEITHNLAFKGVKPNKVLAIIANLPIGVPYAMSFKGYHLEHHKYIGEDGIDVDLPTRLELICLNNVLGKVFFCTFQILFYALRPGFVRSQRPTYWHLLGIAVQLSFDFAITTFVPGGKRMLLYFIMSSFWAGSLHPLAGHFIAEHYVWDNLQQETYSYYGWLNVLAYNVGYHNEHHDFPSVPWTRLPALRALAPEFYDTLPSHPSWPMVIVNFIRDRNVGLFSRVKRPPRAVKTTPPPIELDGGCADEGVTSDCATQKREVDTLRRRK